MVLYNKRLMSVLIGEKTRYCYIMYNIININYNEVDDARIFGGIEEDTAI